MQKFSAFSRTVTVLAIIAALFAVQTTFFSPSTQAENKTSAVSSLLAAFTPGNLVVYRVGAGTDALNNTGAAVFLDEFTTSGTLVQSIALPTTVAGNNRQLIASGTSAAEGLITRSADGRYLLVTGYARNLGGTGSVSATTAADVNRVVGRIDANGTIDATTALTDFSSANSPRSVASTNGTDLYVAGGIGGVRYTTLGATASTQINNGANAVANVRQLNIFNGQLYFSGASGTAVRIGAVGTGTPTTAMQDTTALPGFPLTGSPYGFFFADLTSSVPGLDTLYVADDNTTTGGLQKYSLVSGSWVSNGSVGTAADAYRGLTGIVSGTTVTLYATRKGGSGSTGGGELVSVVDATGYNATITAMPTLLATAAINTAFRGVALTPVGGSIVPRNAPVDLNGDGKTDYSVVRNVGGSLAWYTSINGTGEFRAVQFGSAGDRLIPEDFDGDGKDDIAVWRPGAQGAFFILQSSNGAFVQSSFGQTGDDPSVTRDYDGDGRADLAVYRNGATAGAQSFYYYRPTGTAGSNFIGIPFGISGDKAAPGDYDGDNKGDFTVFRNNGGQGAFYIAKSTGGTEGVSWGLPTDTIAPGDYDGDGKTDFGVIRNAGGNLQWYVLTRANTFLSTTFGITGDQTAQGDYNGDGAIDFAVWRGSATAGQSAFYSITATGTSFTAFPWGQTGDTATASYNAR
jgi:hypothetical protein